MGPFDGKFKQSHLATLNLWRNADGSLWVSILEAKGALIELDELGKLGATIPHDYVLQLLQDAENLK